MAEQHENGGSSLLAFLAGASIGALIGAAVALLTAPQSGTESREDVKEALGKLSERTKELAHKVEESTSTFVKEKREVLGKATKAYREGKKEKAEELEADDTAA